MKKLVVLTLIYDEEHEKDVLKNNSGHKVLSKGIVYPFSEEESKDLIDTAIIQIT